MEKEDLYLNLIVLKIWIRTDMSDPRIYEFRDKNIHTLVWSEFITFYRNLPGGPYTELAEKLVDFIFNYKGGCLVPDRWNGAEPIKFPVDENTRARAISNMSGPGGSFYVRRKYTNCKYYAALENDQFPLFFDGGGAKAKYRIPRAPHPEFPTYLRFWFNRRDAIKCGHDLAFFKRLIYDLGDFFEIGKYKIYDGTQFSTVLTGNGRDTLFPEGIK